MIDLNEHTLKRFMDKVGVADVDGCWPWLAAKRKNGYGYFWLHGNGVAAHRVMYTIHYGTIPENHYVYHKCGHRDCVNPQHLYLSPMPGHVLDLEPVQTQP